MSRAARLSSTTEVEPAVLSVLSVLSVSSVSCQPFQVDRLVCQDRHLTKSIPVRPVVEAVGDGDDQNRNTTINQSGGRDKPKGKFFSSFLFLFVEHLSLLILVLLLLLVAATDVFCVEVDNY